MKAIEEFEKWNKQFIEKGVPFDSFAEHSAAFGEWYLKQWLKENMLSEDVIKNELDNDFKDKWNHGRGVIELRPSSTNFYRVQGAKWLKNHINKLIKDQ